MDHIVVIGHLRPVCSGGTCLVIDIGSHVGSLLAVRVVISDTEAFLLLLSGLLDVYKWQYCLIVSFTACRTSPIFQ